jgi:hypothetical protein
VTRAASWTLLAACLAVPARAQIRVLPVTADVDSLEIGPFYVRPSLTIRNLGVDGNVFNSGDRPRSDRTAILNPGLGLFLPVGRRVRLAADGGLDVAWFARESEERYLDHYGSADLELELRPVTVFAGMGGGRHRRRFTIEIDQRLRRRLADARAGARIGIGDRTALAVELATETEVFAGDEGGGAQATKSALDRESRDLNMELRYQLTHKTTLLATAQLRRDDFTSDPRALTRASSRRILAGFELSPKALVGGHVLIGARVFPERDDQAAPVFSGLALSAQVSRRLAWFARVQLRADRDVSHSFRSGQRDGESRRNAYVYGRYGVSLDLGLPADLLARTSADLERARYLLPILRAGEPRERAERRWVLRGTLLLPVGKRLRLGATVSWAQRISGFTEASYDGIYYGLAAELRP